MIITRHCHCYYAIAAVNISLLMPAAAMALLPCIAPRGWLHYGDVRYCYGRLRTLAHMASVIQRYTRYYMRLRHYICYVRVPCCYGGCHMLQSIWWYEEAEGMSECDIQQKHIKIYSICIQSIYKMMAYMLCCCYMVMYAAAEDMRIQKRCWCRKRSRKWRRPKMRQWVETNEQNETVKEVKEVVNEERKQIVW